LVYLHENSLGHILDTCLDGPQNHCENCREERYFKVKDEEMGMACSINGEERNAFRILVGKPEGK
jgi:hypothetical protein